MVKPFVFQIVGFQDSGKTTFMKNLIQFLKSENFNVGTVKHHGHGGQPEINEDKDSSIHIQAGAAVSIVEGDGRLILQSEKSSWKLDEQINLLQRFELDVILIEGHKTANYPKAVLIKNEQDVHLLNRLTEIAIVLVRDAHVLQCVKNQSTIPSYLIDDSDVYKWLLAFLKNYCKK